MKQLVVIKNNLRMYYSYEHHFYDISVVKDLISKYNEAFTFLEFISDKKLTYIILYLKHE